MPGDAAPSSTARKYAAAIEYFEPFSKAIHIDLVVSPRLGVAPQVEVENRLQLLGCDGGKEFPAGVESFVLNELMQHFWRKVRYQPREVRRIEDAREGVLLRLRGFGTGAFRHELAMIRVMPLKKQS